MVDLLQHDRCNRNVLILNSYILDLWCDTMECWYMNLDGQLDRSQADGVVQSVSKSRWVLKLMLVIES